MKKVKGIKDINDVTVLKWYNFHESYQTGKPKWELFFDEGEKFDLKTASEVYQNLIFQLPKLNIATTYLYLLLIQYTELYSNQLVRHNLGFAEKPNENECNKKFALYINSLKSDFESFNFYQYSIKSDYKEIFKEKFNFEIPEILKLELDKGLSFMHPAQLFDFAKSIKDEVSKQILISPIFINFLINKEKVNIDIDNYQNTLKNYYTENNSYEKWVMIRPQLFNFSESDKNSNELPNYSISKMYEVLFGLEQFAKVQINPKIDSIVKFTTYLELAGNQAEKSKPNAK